MTGREIDRLVTALARDLKLDSSQRYELAIQGRRWASLSDAEVRAEAHAIGSRSTSPLLAGACGVLAVGICSERYAATLSAVDRVKYEQGLHGIGCAIQDSGAMEMGDGDQGAEE